MIPVNTRERILSAAAGAFCANGFKGSTVKEIADAARLNEGTVFRYFPQKQDLYWPAIDWYFHASGFSESFRKSVCRSGPPRELLRQLMDDMQEYLRREPGLMRLVYFTALELDAEKKAMYELHLKPLWSALLTRIKCWMQEGHLAPVNPSLFAIAIIGGVLPYSQARIWFDSRGADSMVVSLTEEFTEFLLERSASAAGDNSSST